MVSRPTERCAVVSRANSSKHVKVEMGVSGWKYKGVLASCPAAAVSPGLGLPSCGLGKHFGTFNDAFLCPTTSLTFGGLFGGTTQSLTHMAQIYILELPFMCIDLQDAYGLSCIGLSQRRIDSK